MRTHYNLLLSILTCILVLWINGFLLINIINPMKNYPPLPDIGFYYLPEVDHIYSNMMLTIYGVYFLIRFMRYRYLDFIAKIIWCSSLLFFIRTLCFISTILPPARTDCYYRKIDEPLDWIIIPKIVSINSNTCIDYIFSGHAIYFVIICLSVFKLSSYTMEKIIFLLYTIIGILFIIAARMHYTVDIILAVSMTIMAYRLIVK